jgi:signal transduction histidine kinase/ligand-binding sensor domain-containing protein
MNKRSQHTAMLTTLLNRWLLLSLVITLSYVVHAQNSNFEYALFNKKQGLTDIGINAIAQDKFGFLWFGTNNGLNRFNGYTFETYKLKESDNQSLISNHITALLADDDGSLWIGTNIGVCRYIPEKDNFRRYQIDYVNDTTLHGNYVNKIFKHKDGSIWIAYDGSGVDIVRKDTASVLHYTKYRNDNYILYDDAIASIAFLKDDYTLLSGTYGLQGIGPAKNVLTPEQLETQFPWAKKTKGGIKSMVVSKDKNTLWMATSDGRILQVDLATSKVNMLNDAHSELISKNIYALYEGHGNLWIASDGLYRIKTNRIEWFNQNGLSQKTMVSIAFEDSGKNLWLGAMGGVVKINYDAAAIKHFHSSQTIEGFTSDAVEGFLQHEDKIWVSLGGTGLFEMSNKEGTTSFSPALNNSQVLGKSFLTFLKHKNEWWAGGWESGFVRIDPERRTIKQFHKAKKNFPEEHVWALAVADDQNIWVGTLLNGLCLFNTQTEKFQFFHQQENDTTTLVNDGILALLKDSKGNLWIGTGNGISVLPKGESIFYNFLYGGARRPKELTSHIFNQFYEDKTGKVWLATQGAGIVIAELNNHQLTIHKKITEPDGLSSNIVTSFTEDDSGNVWVGTTNGITKINPNTYQVLRLNGNAALKGIEFAKNASMYFQGNLYMGSLNTGLYVINVQNIDYNHQKPAVYITDIKFDSKSVSVHDSIHSLPKPIYLTEAIEIDPTVNYYTFEFTALNYTLTEENQYAYKLEGFDDDWITTGKTRTASYSKLSPGMYTLRVKASNNDNIWNENGASLTIHVLPFWWQTAWFKVTLVVAIITMVWVLVRLRLLSVKRHNLLLEQQVRERTGDLVQLNKRLQQSHEEIATQNEELFQSREEIVSQRDYVADQNKLLEEAQDQLKSKNELLEKMHHEKDGMINIIAHDLKSPLKQIEGLSNLIRNSGDINSEQESLLKLINQVVGNGTDLINDLLELNGIQTHEFALGMETIVVSDFITRWRVNYANALQVKQQELKIDLADSLPAISTNKNYLQRILDNLLTNAIKFSPKGSKIYLAVNSRDSQIQFRLRDEGPGISKTDQKDLFKPFKRLSNKPTGGESSSGLGLSIVKLLVEKLHGTIVAVTEPGKGTEFIMNLPVVHQAKS